MLVPHKVCVVIIKVKEEKRICWVKLKMGSQLRVGDVILVKYEVVKNMKNGIS